ncbi:translation initiation factor sui1 protein [Cystoisospora suis]|uniref:Translation initiation factor sui1 protein n=1 Tax=Cystoisospora suis TaxID=483139 RepID=A0A2C6KEX5_9APIC|nr:translation initiation factor sui1 protein [Cystoisospora suis]
MDSVKESDASSSGEETTLSRRHQKREQMRQQQETAKARKKKTAGKPDDAQNAPADAGGSRSSPAAVTDQAAACRSKERGAGESLWEHDKQPEIAEAADVIYCAVCGMPPDFCEFGDRWSECKRWIEKHHPDLLPFACPPGTVNEEVKSTGTGDTDKELAERMLKLGVENSQGSGREGQDEGKKSGGGGKKKVEKSAKVTIQRQSRAKRKTATVITGLDLFGVKLDKAAKLFSKQYACGASVAKNVPGQPPQIEVQGDVEEEIAELIVSTFAVPKESIQLLAAK